MKSFSFLLLSVLLPTFAFCQLQISGKVYDSISGDPLVGASVYNQKRETHTHTDAFGDFSLLKANVGDSLRISYLGYKQLVFVVENGDKLDLGMLPSALSLEQITITSDLYMLNTMANIDIQLNPINSSQDILRKVPGLFIAQHAGGGKAEQIFLRGFDIDHGTDIQITADGMPVNMVSHAHGQGYADLHFLIPETVDNIDFGKGPYYSDKGNFTTAGYVNFKTRDKLDNSMVKIEAGRFNSLRMVGMANLLKNSNKKEDAYIATEYISTDGPFESSQNFNRLNLFGKYVSQINPSNIIKIQASTFQSRWDASGQIPDRAVQSGQITRFGAIDDTEGGQTSRTNFSVIHQSMVGEKDFAETQAYYSKYDFELFSNFTFFLNDSINGDQIKQKESRSIYGFQSSYTKMVEDISDEFAIKVGGGFRYDDIHDNELSRTKNRQETLSNISLGNVNELNGFAYVNLDWEIGKWLINPGVRVDHFRFLYYDQLLPTYNRQDAQKTFVSPKFNLIYSPNDQLQLYAKSGRGFHSNDTRVVVTNQTENILPAAYGSDIGMIVKPFGNLYINVAYWYLFLEQEFVYVGDEAVVEPSGRTTRTGVDASLTLQLNDQFFIDAAINYANPTSIDEPEGQKSIPLAPTLTSIGGISYKGKKGLSGSLRYRFVKDRPANEDNSLIAEGYFITDMSLNYDQPKWGIYFTIENLFNEEWREAQFETESRLRDEPNSFTEIHYTPGTPFFFKTGLAFKF